MNFSFNYIIMAIKRSSDWENYLSNLLDEILNQPRIVFSTLTPKVLPEKAGVYLITKLSDNNEESYYVGLSINLQQRIYRNHLMGDPSNNARLKNYLIRDKTCRDKTEAKGFIRKFCAVRWLEIENSKTRQLFEDYCTATLNPKYVENKD